MHGALAIEKRTAAVARIDGRIGLQKVLIHIHIEAVSAFGADDPGRHRSGQAERSAGRQNSVKFVVGESYGAVPDGPSQKSLVVLQFTISVMLIMGTLVIYRQMNFIQNDDPGYNRSQVLSFALPPTINRSNRGSVMLAMKRELLAENTIESVATSNQPVVNIGSTCSECADWQGHDTSYQPRIAQLSADADFQKTMQLQLKLGRWFTDDNGTDKKSFILNETAVKNFKLSTPVIGQVFIFKGDTGSITGIVKDFSYKSMHEKIGPLVVFNNPAWRNHFAYSSSFR